MIAKIKYIAQKARNQLGILYHMYKIAAEEYPKYLWVLFGYFLTVTLLPFGAIIFPNRIITQIELQSSFECIVFWAAAMWLFYFVLKNGMNYCQKNGEAKGEYLMIRLKMRLNQINMRVPMSTLENAEFQNRKEIAAQISYNSNYFNGYYYSFVKMVSAFLQIISIFFLVRKLSVFILLMLIGMFLVTIICGVYCQKQIHEMEKKNAVLQRMVRYLENMINDYHYGKMIRIQSMADWIYNVSKDKRDAYYDNRKLELKWKWRSKNITSILSGIQETLIYIYLIWMVTNHGISIGKFILYLAAIHQLSAALNDIAGNLSEWNRYSYFAKDLVDFLTKEESIDIKSTKKGSHRESVCIEMENVSFRYCDECKWVLRNLNCVIEKGEKVTIVGENGAGKSTLLALILRLYRPTEGRILVDGVDIWDMDEKNYHELFSMVFQDYQTYAFTVKENVMLMSDNGKQDEAVRKVLEKVEFDINKLASGLDTYISRQFETDGIELSGGEKQKLVMARALYREGKVLILDEPTANLSPIAERQLYHKFYEMAENRTTIFVSHRLSSSRFCDRVLVLDQGCIVENGTHDELMKNHGLYREMFQKQASFYEEELA